ncbi:type I-B CRISPR-associated protein Cas8b/Csh1 [Haloarcula sp. Atlit-7R]|uniref:type I-B CRISPR-associated protein Cas8b/Csh1 n=1 Tax=Haloarcula sp. Atlit-7R TaxID=2282125 RepID=UPI000EF174BF|nr:type I-B CRISPR-associated protein Cas8b/Csh1 [Haloarcula sp. Atlit-7R]RLM96970.1 type I-B CRISPR-associated protein Cas8b/Csh1 [Haloarcula sp. Atlit-7R]
MDTEALDDVGDETIESTIPRRPVASLRDIEVLYGALYTLGRGLTGPYGAYLTPDAAADQIGSESLVVVRVDLRNDKATLGDPPVKLEMFPEDLVSRVAHSKFSAANGDDYSITHQSGQTNGPEKQGDHAVERLTSWPNQEAIEGVASDHEDGWIIEKLAELGADDESEKRIRDEVESLLSEEDQLLHTVAIAFDNSGVSTTAKFQSNETWHYPGEIEVFQEAMAARKTGKFRANTQGADDASGDGTCFVFDTDETVYGVVGDPMKHYLSKQMEKFPALDADRSWQTQGLGRDAAIRAQNADTFLDACATSAPGTSAFYLPYPTGKIDANSARVLYELLSEQVNSDDEYSPVGSKYRRLKATDKLDAIRFSLVIVNKYQKDRWRVLAATPTASTHIIEDITQQHLAVLDSRWVTEDKIFSKREKFSLLSIEEAESLSNAVSSVAYLGETCLGDDADDPSSDDFRFRGTATIASGKQLRVEELLEEYVAKLVNKFDPDDQYPFPMATLAQQYVQLNALRACNLLTADDEQLVTQPQHMSNQTSQATADNRQEQFEQFIEDHPALSDKTRQGVFALGALVGRISRYQSDDGRGTTAVSQYPIGNLTKHNIRRIATEVVESNVIYSEEEGYKQTMYGELMQAVADGLESTDQDELTLSTEDLRFHYAMGIAYGKNDSSTSDYSNE